MNAFVCLSFVNKLKLKALYSIYVKKRDKKAKNSCFNQKKCENIEIKNSQKAINKILMDTN